MTPEEFEAQKKDLTKRFYIDYTPESYNQDGGYCIIDRTTEEIIGYDGGEPEDQTLVRDWTWVAVALNRFSK